MSAVPEGEPGIDRDFTPAERAAQAHKAQSAETLAYGRAVEVVRRVGYGTIPLLQAECRASYNGAAEFLVRMEREGIVGEPDDNGTRRLLP